MNKKSIYFSNKVHALCIHTLYIAGEYLTKKATKKEARKPVSNSTKRKKLKKLTASPTEPKPKMATVEAACTLAVFHAAPTPTYISHDQTHAL